MHRAQQVGQDVAGADPVAQIGPAPEHHHSDEALRGPAVHGQLRRVVATRDADAGCRGGDREQYVAAEESEEGVGEDRRRSGLSICGISAETGTRKSDYCGDLRRWTTRRHRYGTGEIGAHAVTSPTQPASRLYLQIGWVERPHFWRNTPRGSMMR